MYGGGEDRGQVEGGRWWCEGQAKEIEQRSSPLAASPVPPHAEIWGACRTGWSGAVQGRVEARRSLVEPADVELCCLTHSHILAPSKYELPSGIVRFLLRGPAVDVLLDLFLVDLLRVLSDRHNFPAPVSIP